MLNIISQYARGNYYVKKIFEKKKIKNICVTHCTNYLDAFSKQNCIIFHDR